MHFLHLTLKDPRVSCALEEGGGYFYPFFFSHHTIGMLGLEENHLRAGKLKAVR